MKDDVQHGMTYYFHDNGNRSSEGLFDEGWRIGEWKYYDKDGEYISSEFHHKDFETTCGYVLHFSNDRWIYTSGETRGKILKNTSLDNFFRRSVYDKKGNELFFQMYSGCLHDIDNADVTAEWVVERMLVNRGVKYKKVTAYNGMTFDFEGVIFQYPEKTKSGLNTINLMFAKRVEDNVMELNFQFEKNVDDADLEDIAKIVASLEW
jgi:hypothetical protein